MSTRKPHNDLAGYVCELKSKHPKLPGHFVIFDKNKGGEWITGSDGLRYAVIHAKPDDTFGCLIGFSSLPSARGVMKEMCAGSDIGDFGQHEKDDRYDQEMQIEEAL